MDRTVLQTLQLPDDAQIYYTAVGGTRVQQADVIFESPDTPVVGDDLMFDGVGPMFAVHKSDIPGLARDDIFERAGVKYIVTLVRRDEGFMLYADCRLD